MPVEPWRYAAHGVAIAVRVTPRGGEDRIDGLETLANGRGVVKLLAGATSRLKQMAVDGDPRRLGERLRVLVTAAQADG